MEYPLLPNVLPFLRPLPFIKSFQIPDIILCKQLIALCHFRDCPVECPGCLLGICHNRDHQMGNAVVHAKLYHFGSTMINFTSSGVALYKILMINVLMQTDFPDPVAPATSR